MARSLAGDGTVLAALGAVVPGVPRPWSAVVVVARDAMSLRRTSPLLPPLGRTPLLVCWLVEAEAPVTVVPRPEWPALVELRGSRGPGGAATLLRLGGPVPAHVVLAELARAAGAAPTAGRGLVVGTTTAEAARAATPGDPGLVVAPTATDAADPERPVPPDVVLTALPTPALPDHPVLGRPPVVVADQLLLGGPLDEGLLNPTGFRRSPGRGLVELRDVLHQGEVTPRLVSRLRDHRGVRLDWPDEDSEGTARAVAALAMAGVPLVGAPAGPATAARLGPGLAEALAADVDLEDDRSREAHSVVLRRAALLTHSSLGWRARLAARAGVPFRRFPIVSVLLVPRGSAAEDRTADQLRAQRVGDLPLDLEVVEVGADGLGRALSIATGDLVVLLPTPGDLGPDLVVDLLLARHYSGAALVEAPDELVAAADGTVVRRPVATERSVTDLVGGPTLVSRSLLARTGAATAAGTLGTLGPELRRHGHTFYRTHGLGHVARPTDEQERP